MVITIQLASYLNVLYTIEFSFRFNSFQWRSICVFEGYIQEILTFFLEGPYCPRKEIFQTFRKFSLNLLDMHYVNRS